MEIKGRIIQVLELMSGVSKSGNNWKKQSFVLETMDQYPKKICFSMWGDQIEQANIQAGEIVTAYIDIESREYNGRWYTDIKAWRIEREQQTASPTEEVPTEGTPDFPPYPGPADFKPGDTTDDLPF